MKLISMTDFVLAQKEKLKNSVDGFNIEKYGFIINTCEYANFLKQPLELWMFVPCDDEENVLEVPKPIIGDVENIIYQEHFKQYIKAKERCLFEEFSLCEDDFIRAEDGYILFTKESMKEGTVQDMIYYHATLTPTATNKLGL